MTCNLDPSFDEYDGENFLSQTAWSDWALMPDYSFESGTSASDYMDFSPVNGETGPNGGEVYRLEIKNLLQNGDFSSGVVTPWKYYNREAPGTPPAAASAPKMTITSYSGNNKADFNLQLNPGSFDDQLLIRPSTDLINGNTYLSGKNYFFLFNYLDSGIDKYTLYFFSNWDTLATNPLENGKDYQTQAGQNYPYTSIPEVDPNDPTKITLNRFTASGTGSNNDYLGFASKTQVGAFDEFRIVRSPEGDFDLRLRLKMDVDHRPDLDLISGYYRFSVWVKQADLSGTTNTYHADRVEVGIHGYDSNNQLNVDDVRVYYKTQALADEFATSTGTFSGDWSSSWVELVLDSENLIQLPNVSTDSVFELTLSPSNPGSSDSSWNRLSPGTILISEPTLEYSETPWN